MENLDGWMRQIRKWCEPQGQNVAGLEVRITVSDRLTRRFQSTMPKVSVQYKFDILIISPCINARDIAGYHGHLRFRLYIIGNRRWCPA